MNEFHGLEITTPHQETWRKQKKPHNAGTWKPPPPQEAFGKWTFGMGADRRGHWSILLEAGVVPPPSPTPSWCSLAGTPYFLAGPS